MTVEAESGNNGYKRYVAWLLGVLGVVLALLLAMNLLIGGRSLGSLEMAREASRWQQTTQGTTYAPPTTNARPFKILRLADRLPHIDALVLGSSALMGITGDMFPSSIRIYNFTLTGNPTSLIAAEAEYVDRHHSERIKWMLVGLDWSVGMIYLPSQVPKLDLSVAAISGGSYKGYDVALVKRVEDALSWPRVKILGTALDAVIRSRSPLAGIRGLLFDMGGPEYRCPDGTPGRDFDMINRGVCRGFRYDGSWTFAADRRLAPSTAAVLAKAATAASSKYTQHLCATNGEPNAEVLQRLGAVADRFQARGGRVVFYVPPMIPGMELEMLKVPRWRECLQRTKVILDRWARTHSVTVIDAGRSELYSCQSLEFSDEHHAYPECNAKVLRRYFQDVDHGKVGAGLYQPSTVQAEP